MGVAAASSLVADEAEESGEEAADGEGEDGEAAGEEDDLIDFVAQEEEEEEEGEHARIAAELAAAQEDADIDALAEGLKRSRKERELDAEGSKRQKRSKEAAKKGSRGKKRKAEASDVEDDDSFAEEEDVDESDSDGLDEFIASDDEAEAEFEEAERLARAGELAAEEEEEEESKVTQVIRNRLGDAWVVADKSAPLLDDSNDKSPAAKKRRDALRQKHKRERELEAAAAAEADSTSAADGVAAGLGAGASRAGTASRRLLPEVEKSLSSFSVLSEHTLGAAPAPKRQGSAGNLSMPSITRVPSMPSMGGVGGGGATHFSGARLGGSFAAAAASAGSANAVVGVGAIAGSVSSGPRPVMRVASFQDKDRYSTQMLAQLGGASGAPTTSSRTFVFRHDDKSKSHAAGDDIERPGDVPAAERSLGGVGGGSKGGGPNAGASSRKDFSNFNGFGGLAAGRTPLNHIGGKGSALSGSRGKGLLATALGGSKTLARAPKGS